VSNSSTINTLKKLTVSLAADNYCADLAADNYCADLAADNYCADVE